MRSLVIAYGNTDRQDDGAAWRILREIAARLGAPLPETPQESAEQDTPQVDLRYMLQLTPEVASDFAGYGKVVFVDAHTGSVAENVHVEPLAVQYQASPLTHHLTPSSCLAIAQVLHGSAPQALLVSVRGFSFGFSQGLSPQAERLVAPAADAILEWLG